MFVGGWSRSDGSGVAAGGLALTVAALADCARVGNSPKPPRRTRCICSGAGLAESFTSGFGATLFRCNRSLRVAVRCATSTRFADEFRDLMRSVF